MEGQHKGWEVGAGGRRGGGAVAVTGAARGSGVTEVGTNGGGVVRFFAYPCEIGSKGRERRKNWDMLAGWGWERAGGNKDLGLGT